MTDCVACIVQIEINRRGDIVEYDKQGSKGICQVTEYQRIKQGGVGLYDARLESETFASYFMLME